MAIRWSQSGGWNRGEYEHAGPSCRGGFAGALSGRVWSLAGILVPWTGKLEAEHPLPGLCNSWADAGPSLGSHRRLELPQRRGQQMLDSGLSQASDPNSWANAAS